MPMLESLKELSQRFLSERPAGDPRRERDRVDRDRFSEVFTRAEAFARMGPPIDASLEPASAPQNVQYLLSASRKEELPLSAAGTSRGLKAGRNALVQEAGWPKAEADRLLIEAETGDLSEAQFMRTVESALQQSKTSGRFSLPASNRSQSQEPESRRQTESEPQQQRGGISEAITAAEELATGNYQERDRR